MYIIAGKFKKRALEVPNGKHVRPTTSQLREAVFNICQLTIAEAHVLDLFAGSGAIGLEALSRGAQEATFVDSDRLALAAIRKNIATLKVEDQTRVIGSDVLKALHKLSKEGKLFDIIYVDPPYGEGLSLPVLDFLDNHPLLAPEGTLFIEDAGLKPPRLQHLLLRSDRAVGHARLYEYQLLASDISSEG